MELSAKLQVFLRSAVTYAMAASLIVVAIMNAVSTADWFPEDLGGGIIKYGTMIVAAIAFAVRIITIVTPVPVEGMQVIDEDGLPEDVNRGWF